MLVFFILLGWGGAVVEEEEDYRCKARCKDGLVQHTHISQWARSTCYITTHIH